MKENKPAANHPWRKFVDVGRLKADRKIAQKIRHREWAANDELHKIRDRERKQRKRDQF